MGELRAARDAADADLVELRLDNVDQPGRRGGPRRTPAPVIVTCRAHVGGWGVPGIAKRSVCRILEAALAGGAEYVDVEAAAGFAPDLDSRHTAARGIVVSQPRLRGAAEGRRGCVPPCARASARKSPSWQSRSTALSESLPLFALARRRRAEPHVLLAMGPAGAAVARAGGDASAIAGRTPATAWRRARFRPTACSALAVPAHPARRGASTASSASRSATRGRRSCTTRGSPRSVSTPSTCRSKRPTPPTSSRSRRALVAARRRASPRRSRSR